MTTLYIRTPDDSPHLMSSQFPGFGECGVTLLAAKAIAELQVLKFLAGRRCHACLPRGDAGTRRMRKAAA